MTIDDAGFLGEGIQKIVAEIEKKYKDIFTLCYNLNAFAQKTKYEFEVHNKDGQEVIAASLFIKIINGFQAIVILSSYGLTIEGKVLMRSILETLFVLKAITEDPSYADNYIKTDEANRLKLLNVVRDNPVIFLDELRAYATDERVKELKEKIDKEKISELGFNALADKVGMRGIYDTMYRVLSGTAHPTPRATEEYAALNENKEITSFVWGPKETEVPIVLISSIGIAIIALELMIKTFKIVRIDEMGELRKISDILSAKYLKE